MLLSERIKLAMEQAGVSQVELARACGVKPPSVHGWLSGKSKFLRGENLLQAARALKVNQDWLATGTGPMNASDDASASTATIPPGFMRVEAVGSDDPRLVHIPKVKLRLSAGISGFEVEPERFDGSTTTVPRDWMDRQGLNRDSLIAIRVRGESMEPLLYEDDLVVINTADKRLADGGVFAVNYEGEPIVKRLSRDAGRWWLTSDNPDQRKFHRKVCEGDGCIVIGRVVRRESERF
ncbi:LexA family transcriptional regulator [Massilia timonae]|uniref:LexA family transcriptional regulator n=1 Tax=Massilia timonae TaxID=47229 RepID=UPI0028AE685F|nr:S24 family peptidase [Massilia timonae]